MDSERILPNGSRLNTWLYDFNVEIEDELESIRLSQDNSDLISQKPMESDGQAAVTLRGAAEFLQQEVFECDERGLITISRAVFFANQIVCFIHYEQGEDVSYNVGVYLERLLRDEDAQYLLEREVRGIYLAENPNVRDFLKRYLRDIDQYRGYEHLVETVAGMIFMLVERSQGEHFIQGAFTPTTPKDIDALLEG